MVESRIPMFQTQGEFGLMPTASSVGRLEDYFVYVITETVDNSSTSDPIYISIDASFDFRLILLTGEVWSYSGGVPSAIQANPLLLVNIQTASGTLLSDNPCLWNSIVGTAQRPFYILGNLVAKANSQIQITFTNQNASTDYWIMLHMHGVKQWRR